MEKFDADHCHGLMGLRNIKMSENNYLANSEKKMVVIVYSVVF